MFRGIFTVESLAIDSTDAVRSAFGEDLRVTVEFHAHHFVDAAGSVVPVDFVGGNVVSADLPGGRSLSDRQRHAAVKQPQDRNPSNLFTDHSASLAEGFIGALSSAGRLESAQLLHRKQRDLRAIPDW